MNDSLKAADEEVAAVATKGPRVSLKMIEERIAETHYFLLGEAFDAAAGHPANTMTMCALILKNGFVVVGHAAAAAPENFNPELGRKLARENALRQLWPLMGYALRERLSSEADRQFGQPHHGHREDD